MAYTFTYWETMYSTSGKVLTAEWSEVVAELLDHKPIDGPKSKVPGLVLGRMVEGDRRTNANVKTIEALALDIEQGDNPDKTNYLARLEHALERIAHLEYIAYTTFSHTESNPRLRIIFPLATPLKPDEFAGAMSYLNCLTGSVGDAAAQKPSQPVFLPRHARGVEGHWSTHHEGDFLQIHQTDVQEVIDMRMSLGEGRGRAPMEAATRQACKLVLLGRAYAEAGARDETAMRIAWHLARRHRKCTLGAVEEIFYWSGWEMDEDAPDVANIHSKIERGVLKQEAERVMQSEALGAGQATPIVQYRGTYYVAHPTRGYSRAYNKEEVPTAVSKLLGATEGIQLQYTTASGAIKNKTMPTLMNHYGDLAEEVILDLRSKVSSYQDGVFKEASVRWPADWSPRYDGEINRWLDMLGGDKLKDWLSILADLERLSSALVLMGPRSIGKTLLALGCASRFGSQAPAGQQALTGRFQEDLARCPLVYIDEDIEDNPYDRNFLATVRSELSVKERSVNRKFLVPVQMFGAIRCIISANHLPFKQKDAQSGQDLQAIAERFYWVNADGEAATFLTSLGSDKLTAWRKELIGRHIMHLEETRSVSKRSRFGVSGDSEALADLINIGVRWNSWVTEWVCNGVLDGFRKLDTGDADIVNGCIIKEGEVYVRVRAVVKSWERYLPNNRTSPDTRPIADAIQGIAEPDARYQPRDIGITNGNNQQRYYRIRRGPLLAFLEHTGAGTTGEFIEALDRGNLKIGDPQQ